MKTKYPRIEDKEILDLMRKGILHIENVDSPIPRVYYRIIKYDKVYATHVWKTREIPTRLCQQGGRGQVDGGKRRAFDLHHDKRRRKLYLNRVVWMFCNNKIIPEDSHIHHGPKGKHDDSISNLECLTEAQHRFLHSSDQEEDY